MVEEKNEPAANESRGEGEDLSVAIVKTIPKSANEQVTCRRISNDYYRCNWWALQDTGSYDNPSMAGLTVTTSRICQSQFLHVTKARDGLTIRIISGDKPRQG